MSDIGKELFRVADDFASHMRLLDILRSEGEDTGPLEQAIAEYFTHEVTREKIDSVIGYIRYCDQMAAAACAEAIRLTTLQKSWLTQASWLKDCAKGVLEMSGQKRLEGLTAGSLDLRKNGGRQAVTITNPELIPEEMVTYQGTISGPDFVAMMKHTRKAFANDGWLGSVQMERIPHKGRIGEALSKKCFRCDGNGIVEDLVENDHLVEGELPCKECDGSGLARVPGARLEPRGNHVEVK